MNDTQVQRSFYSLPRPTVQQFAEDVVSNGRHVSSRYGDTYEILGGRLEVSSGILISRPGINWSLGWMELLQLIAGVFDLESIKRVAPNANHDLFTWKMAYGPRVVDHILRTLSALHPDWNTRQAVLFIGDTSDGPTSNLPCTLTIQFLIRDEAMNAVVSMRSWDLCRGLPYDLMMFSGLLQMMARCLNYPADRLIVHAGSTHVYVDQMSKLPRSSGRKWRFTDEAPRTFRDFMDWALREIDKLQQGGIPSGIELY